VRYEEEEIIAENTGNLADWANDREKIVERRKEKQHLIKHEEVVIK